MDLYSRKSKSLPQKALILLLEIFLIVLSYRILFQGGYRQIFPGSGAGNPGRHILLFGFNILTFIRMCLTLFYLLKRQIPWAEALNIPVAFALYYVGFALLGYASPAPLGFTDLTAILLFVTGSGINTGSEWLRHLWKQKPENQGKLYTGGLFRHAQHINYFGDLVWVSAYALLCHNPYAALIPAFLFCFFAFYNIPRLDAYLAGRYGEAFRKYASRTKKLIPYIY